MKSMNKVIFTGNLGKDPEMGSTRGSKPSKFARFSIAINEVWNDDSGNRNERVNWVPVTAWNGLAETCAKHLHKGSTVLVEGSLRENVWQDKTTKRNRSRIEVVAREVIFLDRKSADSEPRMPEQPDDDEERPF
jgi:single-strand DNA-binding protein